jgi:hypothetical protein
MLLENTQPSDLVHAVQTNRRSEYPPQGENNGLQKVF